MTANQQIANILNILVERGHSTLLPFVFSYSTGFLIAALFVAARPISRLLRRMRTSYFNWGDMMELRIKIEQRNTLIRWGVGVAFIVSIAASVLATFFVGR